MRLSAFSWSTGVVVCGFHTTLTEVASPKVFGERGGDLADRLEGAGDGVAGLVGGDVIGTGVDRGFEHRVAARLGGGIDDLADAGEHEGDRAGLAQVAAELGEQRAHVGGGAVAVVGQRLDDDGNAARAIALVADLVIALGIVAGGLLDGALDVVLRQVFGTGVLDGEAQAGIGRDREGRPWRRR